MTALFFTECALFGQKLQLGVVENRLVLCDWTRASGHEKTRLALSRFFQTSPVSETHPILSEACEQLQAYEAGELRAFSLPISFIGSAFQKRVCLALNEIPYGATLSYGGFAERLGSRGAQRAVARALAANPLSLLLPCHRIVRSDGSPGGYRGGCAVKERLLLLEAQNAR